MAKHIHSGGILNSVQSYYDGKAGRARRTAWRESACKNHTSLMITWFHASFRVPEVPDVRVRPNKARTNYNKRNHPGLQLSSRKGGAPCNPDDGWQTFSKKACSTKKNMAKTLTAQPISNTEIRKKNLKKLCQVMVWHTKQN